MLFRSQTDIFVLNVDLSRLMFNLQIDKTSVIFVCHPFNMKYLE